MKFEALTMLERRIKRSIGILLMVILCGCSSGVDPISIHDPSVPAQDRRIIADSQDRVAVARAHRDDVSTQLAQIERWREDIAPDGGWPEGTSSLVSSLHQLVDARIHLVELRRARADVEIELAKAELELSTARVAVRNDMAVYDLESIMQTVDEIREESGQIDRQIMVHMENLDEVTQDWWDEYARFADQGGDVTPFYAVFDRPRF